MNTRERRPNPTAARLRADRAAKDLELQAYAIAHAARCGQCCFWEAPFCKEGSPVLTKAGARWPEPPRGADDWCGQFAEL